MKKLFISLFILGSFISLENIEAKVKPTALCRDNTYSYSAHRQGTCSHHKGVKVWYK